MSQRYQTTFAAVSSLKCGAVSVFVALSRVLMWKKSPARSGLTASGRRDRVQGFPPLWSFTSSLANKKEGLPYWLPSVRLPLLVVLCRWQRVSDRQQRRVCGAYLVYSA